MEYLYEANGEEFYGCEHCGAVALKATEKSSKNSLGHSIWVAHLREKVLFAETNNKPQKTVCSNEQNKSA